MRIRMYIMLVLVAMAMAGCMRRQPPQDPMAAKIGAKCVVQFRRDALGAGATIPVAPMIDSMNGAQVSLYGTLVAVDPEWVVVRASVPGQRDSEVWINRESVLLVRFEPK